MLFSTGQRFLLWKEIEKFPKFCDISLFDRDKFRGGFSNLPI